MGKSAKTTVRRGNVESHEFSRLGRQSSEMDRFALRIETVDSPYGRTLDFNFQLKENANSFRGTGFFKGPACRSQQLKR